MKPDVIVCWPRSCDYPLWRQFIRDNRARFAKVIVAFTEHDGLDYQEFVINAMKPDDMKFVWSNRRPDQDWRDGAVNGALSLSDAEWVWFTEQDLIITDPRFWWVTHGITDMDVIGWHENNETRWHPSCLFVRRSAIDRTGYHFGVTKHGDHFAQFSDELPEGYRIRPLFFEHLQGLTQNHWLVDSGQAPTGIFNEARFRQYLRDCMEVTVPLDPGWVERGVHYLRASAA